MKIVCLVFLVIEIEASVMITYHMFNRVLRESPADHSLYKLSSDTGILSPVMCALYCKDHPSFSYTEVDKKCDIYSRFIAEGKGAMYFSKVLFDCSDISIESSSGVYEIRTTPGKRVDLFCDTDTADGPWTVIQRRTIGDVDFYRNWTDYKNGFGDLLGDFWIGNDNLHDLTTSPRILRVELEGLDGTKGYAQYSNFQVANEDQNYRLLVQGFSGNVSYDAMASHNDQSFSTYDRDNDKASGNCASNHNGAWWYWNCFHSNLNAGFVTDEEFNERKVILWYFFPNVHGYDPTKTSMMMIR